MPQRRDGREESFIGAFALKIGRVSRTLLATPLEEVGEPAKMGGMARGRSGCFSRSLARYATGDDCAWDRSSVSVETSRQIRSGGVEENEGASDGSDERWGGAGSRGTLV